MSCDPVAIAHLGDSGIRVYLALLIAVRILSSRYHHVSEGAGAHHMTVSALVDAIAVDRQPGLLRQASATDESGIRVGLISTLVAASAAAHQGLLHQVLHRLLHVDHCGVRIGLGTELGDVNTSALLGTLDSLVNYPVAGMTGVEELVIPTLFTDAHGISSPSTRSRRSSTAVSAALALSFVSRGMLRVAT